MPLATLAAALVAAWALAAAAHAQSVVANGSMTDGDAQPTGWTTLHPADGGLAAHRDTEHFASAPASLRLDTPERAAGNISTPLPDLAGQTVTFRGRVKATPSLRYAAVVLFVQDADWQQLAWVELARAHDAADWTAFEATVTVPPAGAHARLLLFADGPGSAWLDDLEALPASAVPAAAARAAPATAPLPRGPESPTLTHVAAVAPGVLALHVQAGRVEPSRLVPDAAQPGDTVTDSHPDHPFDNRRRVSRDGKLLGTLVGPAGDTLHTPETFRGQPLQTDRAADAATYRLRSDDDPAYAQPLAPVAVYLKSKPTDWEQETRALAMGHTIYLRLPHPLQSDATYTLEFGGLNLAEPRHAYRHDPRATRSEAVHVNHVGFHPADPVKRGYFSIWLGTGGAASLPPDTGFSLIDETTGREVYTGRAAPAWPASKPERLKLERNYNKTDVHTLDFSDFRTPGRYRLYVHGIGCSYPFGIAEDAAQHVFRATMLGFLHQRSGVELGPPLTEYRRPRPMHPADGVRVHASTHPLMDGNMGLNTRELDSFAALVAGKTEETLADAWGGYMDAGDWDRRIQHLDATRLHLELFELAAPYFSRLGLALPPDEANNHLPDLLDEALFNLDCYRRMQLPHGGVRGGIESAAHPKVGEPSWLESLPIFAYAPDLWSSHQYAATAARAALVLRGVDDALSSAYAESALRAMAWAEAEYPRWLADDTVRRRPHVIRDTRNLAALELYRLTRDRRWHDLFLQTTALTDDDAPLASWGEVDQREAAFVYARLPDDLCDADVRRRAAAAIVREAETALEYARGNAWSLATPNPSRPLHIGFYSAPDVTQLIRAHALTGREDFYRATVAAVQFSLGANPMNMTYITGVGHDWPRHPLHVDSRYSGQPAPAGITVYGQFELELDMHREEHWIWPIRWHLGHAITPDAYAWPSVEAYHDVYLWPMMCEYTIHQTMAPNSHTWGYLAARQAEASGAAAAAAAAD